MHHMENMPNMAMPAYTAGANQAPNYPMNVSDCGCQPVPAYPTTPLPTNNYAPLVLVLFILLVIILRGFYI
ncbi:hypothetical protein [Marinicrinis sediminis]|uniref:Sporulation protein YjcZ n=1 Tax=Marinicrinis sediminis TaxID=1652465 RepID=A0ABW5R7N6_9BACL